MSQPTTSPPVCMLVTFQDWERLGNAIRASGGDIDAVDIVVVNSLPVLPIRGLARSVTIAEDGTTAPAQLPGGGH